jgi:diguanylate cyclase (GGDEF)-like protein
VVLGDHLTGPANFTLLYLGPIALGTWLAGLGAGLALSVLATVASVAVDARLPSFRDLSLAVKLWDTVVQLGVFLSLALALDALRQRLGVEQRLARTDSLTGVANRRAFLEASRLEIERLRRHGRPLTVVYLDCDAFKSVNDRFGHQSGDALLVAVSSDLRRAVRAVDTVARLGGDEFGVLLPETDGPAAQGLVDRLRATIDATLQKGGWPVTFSVGVVTFAAAPASEDEMVRQADQRMYEAKRSGRGQVRFEVVPAGTNAAAGERPLR